MLQRTCWLLVAVVAVVFSVPWFRSTPPAAAGPPAGEAGPVDPVAALARGHEWIGSASCAAASCHGGTGPKGAVRSEYTTWAVHDPHTKSFGVLFNDKSVRIAKNLGLKNAHEADLCLSCHVHPDWKWTASNGKHSERYMAADGVGCESCHGPAKDWVAVHFQAGWDARSAKEKAALGFRNTKDLLIRAETCVPCHVGAPGGDVNHDLIGAGHPRMNFEFGAYQAVLPRHWSRDKDRERYPDLEARSWALGQALSAEAATRLTQYRAHDKALPWPEFAEYDCYACHHDLRAKSARQTKAHYGKRMPGLLPWGSWYTTMLPQVAGPGAEEDLRDLRRLMEVPLPNRAEVAKEAANVAAKLRGRASEIMKQDTADAGAMKERLLRVLEGARAKGASWDEAAQLYLAVAALHHARSDLGAPLPQELTAALREMAASLRFPRNFDSPGDRFSPEAFGRQLGIIREQARRVR